MIYRINLIHTKHLLRQVLFYVYTDSPHNGETGCLLVFEMTEKLKKGNAIDTITNGSKQERLTYLILAIFPPIDYNRIIFYI